MSRFNETASGLVCLASLIVFLMSISIVVVTSFSPVFQMFLPFKMVWIAKAAYQHFGLLLLIIGVVQYPAVNWISKKI